MKRLAIIALFLIVLVACAPTLPKQDQEDKQEEQEEQQEEQEEEQEEVEANTTEPVETNMTDTANMTDSANMTGPVETNLSSTTDLPIKEVTEGDLVSFPNLRAVDPDGDPIFYTFTEPLNSNGEWQTVEGDAGEHIITITASDGQNTVEQQVLVVVIANNKPPIIELAGSIEALEGTIFTLQPNVTDPDGDKLTVAYTGWMQGITKNIGYDDAGPHKVIITASDGHLITKKEVIITVMNLNRGPNLVEIPPQTIKEGQIITIKPSARDPDGDNVSFSFDFPLDPEGSWETQVGDAGDYEVLVIASDGNLTAETIVLLTVNPVNQPPVIELESPITVQEGQTVVLAPIVTDKEGDEVQVTYSGWMTGTTKVTDYNDAGNHKVTITARDTAENEVKLEVIIVVEEFNRPPIFGAGSFV